MVSCPICGNVKLITFTDASGVIQIKCGCERLAVFQYNGKIQWVFGSKDYWLSFVDEVLRLGRPNRRYLHFIHGNRVNEVISEMILLCKLEDVLES